MHAITTTAMQPSDVSVADVDGDGDLDVLSSENFGDRITWYENDGSENFTAHIITNSTDGARAVNAADLDGDGDIDVLSASNLDDRIAWYENDGSENFTTHIITTDADGARSVTTADLDGDGDLDVLSASNNDDKIAWYENDGSENFTTHIITTGADGAWNVRIADVDGDGDFDVLSASKSDHSITWYENEEQLFVATPTFTEGGVAVVLDAVVSIRDTELDALNSGNGNYAGASLGLVRNGGSNSDDVFAFNDGNGISLIGSDLIKNSQIIGTFDTTTIVGTLTIIFTDANGETPITTDVDNILGQITYANSSVAPPVSVQFDWTFNDGNTGSQGSSGALQDTGSTTVTITAVDNQTATVVNNSLTVAEGDVNTVLTTSDLSAIDTDTDDATLLYTVGNVSNGTLTINGSAWAASTNDTFTQQDIIDGTILYTHDDSNTTSDSFSFTLSDGTNTLTGQTMNITLDPVDDLPGTTVIPFGGAATVDASRTIDTFSSGEFRQQIQQQIQQAIELLDSIPLDTSYVSQDDSTITLNNFLNSSGPSDQFRKYESPKSNQSDRSQMNESLISVEQPTQIESVEELTNQQESVITQLVDAIRQSIEEGSNQDHPSEIKTEIIAASMLTLTAVLSAWALRSKASLAGIVHAVSHLARFFPLPIIFNHNEKSEEQDTLGKRSKSTHLDNVNNSENPPSKNAKDISPQTNERAQSYAVNTLKSGVSEVKLLFKKTE